MTIELLVLFIVLLKKFAGSEEEGDKVDVQKLFGYIGLFTLLGLWWLGEWNISIFHDLCIVFIIPNFLGSFRLH